MTSNLKSTLVSVEVMARYLLAEEKFGKDLKVIYHHFHVCMFLMSRVHTRKLNYVHVVLM